MKSNALHKCAFVLIKTISADTTIFYLKMQPKTKDMSRSFQSMRLSDRQTDKQTVSHGNSNIDFNNLTNTVTIFDELLIQCHWFLFICMCSFVYICISKFRNSNFVLVAKFRNRNIHKATHANKLKPMPFNQQFIKDCHSIC